MVLGRLRRVPVTIKGIPITKILGTVVKLEGRRGKDIVREVCWGERMFLGRKGVIVGSIRLELWVFKKTRVKWNIARKVW
jgi:hypothetical protein